MFPLRVRSYFTLQQGTASPAAICRRVRELGYPGLAMTDRDNLYGLWEFLRACRAEGLKPVVGAELSEPGSGRVVTFLVKNQTGYSNLCTLLSRRHLDRSFSLENDVLGHAAGLVLLCADLALLQFFARHGLEVAADRDEILTGGCERGVR